MSPAINTKGRSLANSKQLRPQIGLVGAQALNAIRAGELVQIHRHVGRQVNKYTFADIDGAGTIQGLPFHALTLKANKKAVGEANRAIGAAVILTHGDGLQVGQRGAVAASGRAIGTGNADMAGAEVRGVAGRVIQLSGLNIALRIPQLQADIATEATGAGGYRTTSLLKAHTEAGQAAGVFGQFDVGALGFKRDGFTSAVGFAVESLAVGTGDMTQSQVGSVEIGAIANWPT